MTAHSGGSGATAELRVPPDHHLALMCLVCKDGYGGTDLRGAQVWITQHVHLDPEDDSD